MARAARIPILDPTGQPMAPSIASRLPGGAGPARAALSGHGENFPYDAASFTNPEVAAWNPWIGSPDFELNPMRDRIVSRQRDLVRNDGWANGAVTTLLDNVVGGNLRLKAHPDYRAIQALTFNKAFDAAWADEFGRRAEALFRVWSEDPGRWGDAARNLTFGQAVRVAFRHKLIDGDALAVMLWKPDDVQPGKARYATRFLLVDPDRLSNPSMSFDQAKFRGGVEIDEYGAPLAYHIRKAHPGDWFDAAKSIVWERIPKETATGRPMVVHDFDHDRAGQHRGGAGILTPVLNRLKMLSKYDKTELQAAIINSVFSAYITSPYDHQMTQDAIGEEITSSSYISALQADRVNYHSEKRLALNDARIPFLFPGEDIKTVTATHPISNFDAFEGAVLRSIAAATGLSAEQITHDYSKVNYSSARAALIEAWKTMTRRREQFASGFCAPIYAAWLEEAYSNGEFDDVMPNNSPEFQEMRASFARCRFIGPGRGWVDPLKERQGGVLGIQAGFSTLERECAEQGSDWEEILDQRKIELDRFKELGLASPTWSNETENALMSEPGTSDGEGDPTPASKITELPQLE